MAFVIDYHEPNIEVADKGRLEHVMRRCERYELLWDNYLPIDQEDSKLLFQLINSRYERYSKIKKVEVFHNQLWIFC